MDEKIIEEARLIADSLTNVKHQMITVYTIRDLCNRLEKAHRPWVGLTDEEIEGVERWVEFKEEGSGRIPVGKLVRYIEAKLKEKNT